MASATPRPAARTAGRARLPGPRTWNFPRTPATALGAQSAPAAWTTSWMASITAASRGGRPVSPQPSRPGPGGRHARGAERVDPCGRRSRPVTQGLRAAVHGREGARDRARAVAGAADGSVPVLGGELAPGQPEVDGHGPPQSVLGTGSPGRPQARLPVPPSCRAVEVFGAGAIPARPALRSNAR
jgi:hypothetical protein